jgi:nucleobase:cation symporter-1, NCS1 family
VVLLEEERTAVAPEQAGVPVREGVYGDRVAAVEPGGIEFIPERERHGRPLDLFWTWTSPNLEFATVFVGVIPVAFFGGGFWPTALALVLGTALGSLTHCVLSSWGPKFGIPQMVQARGAFGFLGNVLPAGLNTFTAGVGWFIVNSVSGAFALQSLFGWQFWIGYVLVVVAQVGVAFVGHNFVHVFERAVFPYLAVVFALATVVILSKTHFGAGFNPHYSPGGGSSAAFVLALFISYGYAVGWNPYASDYSRYLPSTVDRRRVGLSAALGVFVSCVVLEVVGAGVGTLHGASANPTTNFTKPLGHALGDAVLIGITIGAVAANVLNIYSGAMSFLTIGVRLPLRLRRALVAVASGTLGLVIGLVFKAQVGPGSHYENFLLAITYWITPFLAVVLLDYWLRHGSYDEREFFERRRLRWRAPLAMAVGMAASVPFWDQGHPIPLGWFPKHHPQIGDLSFFVGFAIAAVVYLALNARAVPVRLRRARAS